MTEKDLDRVFKAIGDGTRRRIIDLLCERQGMSLFEICALSAADGGQGLSRQAISQHLDLLEKAGLVRSEWAGRTKVHFLDLQVLRNAVRLWLEQHLKEESI